MSLIFISNYVATMSCYPPLLPSSPPPHPAAHWHSRPCYGLGFGYSLQPRTDKAATVRGSQRQLESVRVRPEQARPKSKSCQSQATGQEGCGEGSRNLGKSFWSPSLFFFLCQTADEERSKRWCTDSKTIEFLINWISSIHNAMLPTASHHYQCDVRCV